MINYNGIIISKLGGIMEKFEDFNEDEDYENDYDYANYENKEKFVEGLNKAIVCKFTSLNPN